MVAPPSSCSRRTLVSPGGDRATTDPASAQAKDDVLTVCAISLLAPNPCQRRVRPRRDGSSHRRKIRGVVDCRLVRRLRLTPCGRGRNPRKTCGWGGFLACAAQQEKCIGSSALFSPYRSRVQPLCWHRLFLLFRRHRFWRLGSGDCRPARALVVADAPRCRGGGVLLLGPCSSWAAGWCGTSEFRGTSLAGCLDSRSFLMSLRFSWRARGETLESDGNPIALAIRSAGDGGRALRASLADVLHSEWNCCRAALEWP